MSRPIVTNTSKASTTAAVPPPRVARNKSVDMTNAPATAPKLTTTTPNEQQDTVKPGSSPTGKAPPVAEKTTPTTSKTAAVAAKPTPAPKATSRNGMLNSPPAEDDNAAATTTEDSGAAKGKSPPAAEPAAKKAAASGSTATPPGERKNTAERAPPPTPPKPADDSSAASNTSNNSKPTPPPKPADEAKPAASADEPAKTSLAPPDRPARRPTNQNDAKPPGQPGTFTEEKAKNDTNSNDTPLSPRNNSASSASKANGTNESKAPPAIIVPEDNDTPAVTPLSPRTASKPAAKSAPTPNKKPPNAPMNPSPRAKVAPKVAAKPKEGKEAPKTPTTSSTAATNGKPAPPGKPAEDGLTAEKRAKIIKTQAYIRGWRARKKFVKLARSMRNRTKLAQEIVSTERTYVNSLRVLIELYLQPLRFSVQTSPDPFCTMEDITTIFSNIELILNVNAELLKDLDEKIEKWNNFTSCMGDIILRMAPFLKLYTQYCNNYDNATACVLRASKNEKFQRFLDSAKQHPDSKDLRCMDFLIMPIQRIPRYKLLLQEMIKLTPNDHPDYNNLTQANDKIGEIATLVNESMKNAEKMNKIIEIQQKLTGDCPNLVEPARRFVKEGQLTKNKERRWFFLFNDKLVYAQKQLSNSYKYKGTIPLNTTWVKDITAEESGLRNAFQIVATKKSYIVSADTPEEKTAWMKDINNQIDVLTTKDPTLINQRADAGAPKKAKKSFFSSKNDEEEEEAGGSGGGGAASTTNGDDDDETALRFMTVELPIPTLQFGALNVNDKRGVLNKQGQVFTNWRSRTFVMKDYFLHYFKATSPTAEPAGSIPLLGCTVKSDPTGAKKFMFIIGHAERRTFCICAKSDEEMNDWISSINQVVNNIPPVISSDGLETIISLLYWGAPPVQEQAAMMIALYAREPANHPQLLRSQGVDALLAALAAPNQATLQHSITALRHCMTHAPTREHVLKMEEDRATKGMCMVMSGSSIAMTEQAAWAVVNLSCPDAENLRIAAANNDGKVEGGPIPPVVAILTTSTSELAREGAGRALAKLACNAYLRTAFFEYGALAPLVNVLTSKNPSLQAEAARALGFLSRNDKMRKQYIPEAGALPVLASMLVSQYPDVLEQVMFALKNLANDDSNREALRDQLALPKVISLLTYPKEAVRLEAVETVRYFASSDTGKEAILDAGGLPPLIELLTASNQDIQEQSTRALAHLSYNESIIEAVRDQGGLERLIELLKNTSSMTIAEQVARALGNLTTGDNKNREIILDKGGLPTLLGYLQPGAHTSMSISGATVRVVANLVISERAAKAVIDSQNGLQLVLNMTVEGTDAKFEARKQAIKALRYMAAMDSGRAAIQLSKKVPRLGDIISSSDEEMREHALVLAETLGLDASGDASNPRASQNIGRKASTPNGLPVKASSSAKTTSPIDSRASVQVQAAVKVYLIATFEFIGEGEAELSFAEGEKILLLEKTDDEWYYGENSKGAEGYFPAAYTEPLAA